MSLWLIYKKEFDAKVATASSLIQSNNPSHASHTIQELNQLLESMELEAPTQSALIPLRQQLSTLSSQLSRIELVPEDMNARLINNTQTVMETNGRLENAHRIAIETEQVGQKILLDLRGQTEQIQGVRGRLVETNSAIDSSNRLIREMGKRMVRNKMTTVLIIFIILVAIVVTLYGKLSGRRQEV